MQDRRRKQAATGVRPDCRYDQRFAPTGAARSPLRPAMATPTITTELYLLYPSPQNQHRVVFEHQVFVPYPYALIDLPAMDLAGKYTLFAAHRRADGKMGQLVSFELEADRVRFERLFTPD